MANGNPDLSSLNHHALYSTVLATRGIMKTLVCNLLVSGRLDDRQCTVGKKFLPINLRHELSRFESIYLPKIVANMN